MKIAQCIKDNMIFQSGKPFRIWGSGAEGTVCLNLEGGGKSLSQNTEAKEDGCFCAEFSPMPAGFSAYNLTVKNNGETILVRNIKFGEVFLFAGQSNMNYPASAMENYDEILSKTLASDNIGILNIKESFFGENGEIHRPDKPQSDLSPDFIWQGLSEAALKSTSAIAVMVALDLRKRLNLPIGIIDTSLGGVSIDTYLSREMVDDSKEVKNFLVSTQKYLDENAKYNIYGIINYTQMCGIYNEKIAPILNFNFKAILWYQGENSAATYRHSKYYYHALKALIKGYRKIFKDSQLPFIAFNIAATYYPYGEYGYNYINEAINNACKLPCCYAIPQYDIIPKWLIDNGDRYFHPIHPVNKKAISIRASDIIYSNLYQGKKLKYPSVKAVEYYGDYALAEIGDLSAPLKKQDTVYGFTVAGESGVYYKANAEVVSENKVKVFNENVKNPKFITYAFFQKNYICNLMSENNMPVLPYRSRAEECAGKKYCFTDLTQSCDFDKIWEDNFGYECGGGYFVSAWMPGQITSRGNSTLKFNKKEKFSGKSCLQITYKKKAYDYGYFGVSPNVNVCGQQNGFHNYSKIICCIKSAENVEFHGALAKINSGKIIKFQVIKENIPQTFINLSKDYCLYSISLKNYQTGEEGVNNCGEEILKNINTLEFYFRADKDCIIYFNNYEFGNSV